LGKKLPSRKKLIKTDVHVSAVTLPVLFGTYGCRSNAQPRGLNMSISVSRKTIHSAQTKDRPGFWAIVLVVAICLLMLTLSLRSEDFAQALQLYGQWP
jgi:hypothetical protein